MGGLDADLGHIVDLQPAALVGGGLHPGGGVGQHGVEHAGGDAHGRLIGDVVDQIKEPVHPLARQGGDEHDGGVGHIGQIPPHVLAHPVHGLVVLLDGVPLVDHDDAGLARLVGQARHLGVLLGDPLARVDHDEAHVTPLNGHGGPEDGELLDAVVHLGLLAHAGGVDEQVLALGVLEIAVHRVPGGARHVADDHPLLPQNPVDQGGLAHVGLADHRHLDHVVLHLLLVLRGEVAEALVQQIAGAVAVDGGDGDGIAQAQVVELIDVRVGHAHLIHLVHRQHHRLAGAQQHVSHLLVGGGQAGLDVAQEHDHRGVVDGDLRLLAHEGQDLAVGGGLDAAGVYQIELPVPPLRLGVQPVTGDAGGVLHDGQPLAHQLIEQHGLAHVGAAHDGN